jgi:hypothetical protein
MAQINQLDGIQELELLQRMPATESMGLRADDVCCFLFSAATCFGCTFSV